MNNEPLASPEDSKTDAVVPAARVPVALIEAAERAVELLWATEQFIDKNPVEEYTVVYDDAECDGYCLAADCMAAREELVAALNRATKQKPKRAAKAKVAK